MFWMGAGSGGCEGLHGGVVCLFYECFCGLVLRRRKEKQEFFGGR